MDPNANLQNQQNLLSYIESKRRRGDDIPASVRSQLLEARRALRAWLTSGGFEPDWMAYGRTSTAFRAWMKR